MIGICLLGSMKIWNTVSSKVTRSTLIGSVSDGNAYKSRPVPRILHDVKQPLLQFSATVTGPNLVRMGRAAMSTGAEALNAAVFNAFATVSDCAH